MSLRETLRASIEAIATHRSRSLLTVLGILIGIAAVIITVGLGEGSQAKVTAAVSSLGSNLLVVSPGSSTGTGGVRGGLGSASTLTLADATALASHLDAPDISAVAPVVQKNEAMSAGGNTWSAPVIGTTPPYLGIRSRQISFGSFITSADVTSANEVAILGTEVSAELFPGQNPVGQTININGSSFSVIGLLASAGSSATTNQDDQVIVPITTAQSLLVGGRSGTSVDQILLQAKSQNSISAAYQEANALLLQAHQITTPSAADFTITPETQLLTTATSVSKTLTFLLTGIAAVSLLVGGIGVMNIMLVSVTERIAEIGLRKALGATPRAILRQFLTEALLLGLAGGILGVVLGIGASLIVPKLTSNPVALSVPAIIGAVVVAAGIGLTFGVYPASRAARLAPIDALRGD
ncbi:MAG: FtsX-like permease family protein [Acidimicrobiaceae bacterium]|nr:FtsX-like permease family protein [Acidimicrobiaceae bacterium]